MATLIATVAHAADDDTDKPIPYKDDTPQGVASVDPGGLLTLEVVDDDSGGATIPLVINEQGNALMRGPAGATPTTVGIVEGSRIPIPRAPDGSCPNVSVTLSDTLEAQMTIFNDPDHQRKFLAATVRTELDHGVNSAACEVVITRARGYVTYRKRVVKKHLSGKAGRDLAADFAEPVYPDVPLPTPTPADGRAASAPPANAPTKHPAFRATPSGTIEPMPLPDEPRSSHHLQRRSVPSELFALPREPLNENTQSLSRRS
ncbi:MAG: hypothetical protein OZ922_15245 [Myxococcales bacterium]|nr:hypothetical protein [Myxococcales bacterium]